MSVILTPASEQWSAPLGSPSGAWLSDDGVYRWLLWRTFAVGGDAPPLAFGMLNPSKAGVDNNDPTVIRCMGFAHRERAGGIIVVNCSPYRTHKPRELIAAHKRGVDVEQRERNDGAIKAALAFNPSIILGWGASIPAFLDGAARALRRAAGDGALCLGKTASGEPRHPLMLRKDVPITRFP